MANKLFKQKSGYIIVTILTALIITCTYLYTERAAKTTSWSNPLSGKVIVLDPGHGGVDGGAVGKGEVLEKDIALSLSKKVRDYLQEAGAFVLMTRETDRDLAAEDTEGYSRRKTEDLKARVQFVKDNEADLFVSIHLNAIPSTKWNGAQTFYHPHVKGSKTLAKLIQDSMRNNLENTTRYAKATQRIYLLKSLDIPSVLIEAGFLSNPSERELLKTDQYQAKVAASIYQGILRYYADEKPPEK